MCTMETVNEDFNALFTHCTAQLWELMNTNVYTVRPCTFVYILMSIQHSVYKSTQGTNSYMNMNMYMYIVLVYMCTM